MLIRKKALSLLLSAILGVAMLVALPLPAYAVEPDLEFGLSGSSSDVSKAYVYDLEYSQSDSVFSIDVSTDPMTFAIGDKYPSYLANPYTPWDVYPSVLAIGDYFAVLELEADGTLINFGQVIVDNSMLGKPYPGTTKIAGGIGKVTVSSYEVVDGCQLYLVPSGSLPAANWNINLRESVEVTGNGDITGLAADTYILYTVWTDSIPGSALGGYRHGAYRHGSSVTVASSPACRIGSTDYHTLEAALEAVGPGETITLLRDITEDAFVFAVFSYTIDLAGYNLVLLDYVVFVTIIGNLKITGGGSVTLDSTFIVEGGILSIEADIICNYVAILAQHGAQVTVTGNITQNNPDKCISAYSAGTVVNMTGSITTPGGSNISVGGGAQVKVIGDLICTASTSYNSVIDASPRGYVELYGSIETKGIAVYANESSEVYVKGNIDAGISKDNIETGLSVFESSIEAFDSKVFIDGNVSIREAFDGNCINAQGDSSVIIKGDVGVEGDRCNAVYASSNATTGKATVSIGGSVSVSGSDNTAVYTEAGGDVTVNGGVTTESNGSRGVFIYADIGDAGVDIGGSITATGDDSIGIDSFRGGIATVGGNVVASGSNAIGVQVQYGSVVTIEGKITAPTYISFGELTIKGVYYNPYTKTSADNDSSSMKPDYMQYSMSYQGEGIFAGDYIDYVWVKNLEITTPDPGPGTGPDPGPGPGPGPNPNPSIPGTGDFDTLLASSFALLFALMGASALLVSRRKVARARR